MSLWEDDPYGAVISYIPSVIISVEQVIFPGLSFPVVNLLLVGTIALLYVTRDLGLEAVQDHYFL